MVACALCAAMLKESSQTTHTLWHAYVDALTRQVEGLTGNAEVEDVALPGAHPFPRLVNKSPELYRDLGREGCLWPSD